MIAVVGATGFIGAPATRALAATGESVRALVRNEGRARALFADRADSRGSRVDLVVGDMHDPAALARLMADARAVYVLVQTVTSPQTAGTGDFAEAERGALRQIVAAAHAAGVTRLLTVGLIGAAADAPNAWVRARADNDAFLLESGLFVTVLRAGLVAGVGSAGFDALLARQLARSTPRSAAPAGSAGPTSPWTTSSAILLRPSTGRPPTIGPSTSAAPKRRPTANSSRAPPLCSTARRRGSSRYH